MTFANNVRAFLRTSGPRKARAIEAAAELVRARLMTLLPTRVYSRDFGRMNSSSTTSETQSLVSDAIGNREQIKMATEIGHVVEIVAKTMPFRAVCLQQSLASCRMLRRRGIRAVVCLAVNRHAAERAMPERGKAAHAWIEVGSEPIGGGGNLEDYAVVARFG